MYKVVGIMSGTSLDGLDIAYCEFVCKGSKDPEWSYSIKAAETIKYGKEWKAMLKRAYSQNHNALKKFDKEYGTFIGKEVLKFIAKKRIYPHFISSHGHTIFHQPDKGITYQAGDGKILSEVCRLPVVCDFRSGDVALGGQGAPLVPLVDKILFSKNRFCLNLGGFANISYDDLKGRRIAFDICPVNIVLNELAIILGHEYDKNGKIASKGKINAELLRRLNALTYYKRKAPKSLGREWVEQVFMPALQEFEIPVQDIARTVCEHIAFQMASTLDLLASKRTDKLLVTGGGVYNKFLMDRIKSVVIAHVVVPNDKTIQFKEAMAFAFLGVLRMRKEINILKSVTGAKRDSSGGTLFNR